MRLFVMGQLQELAAVGGSCRKPRLHSEDADGAGQRRKKNEEKKKKKREKKGREFGAPRIFG